ncbi:DMSO reductase anchor subunit [Mesorhizobium albiziae]|uniref:DMSO reductase anchor subunit n=1 Tax=Neomesorhizobium albiziae TaxID=335020 RepID=A0A1I3V498_9HYPH|nr:DmsC/YnfH family molybdoenzyme membrane anchor subunit [Mesorhizobium albiziae]GLS28645.1 DMSO reductase [Mesorhizobium albiziae]SFJ90055.1 DMSO reductase anchor subunit [Mesorhizobium albiziae]
MHPAPSIIVFTTLSGLGYGLAALLGLGVLDPSLVATKIAHVLALLLIAAGLASSTLHLGNPQRAWRALSQWRSSWLSREGVMAILTFVPLLWSAWAAVIESRYLMLPGLLGTLFAGITVYCTAMIYASLKSVQAWHTPLTPLCYLLFAASGGALLGLFFAASSGGPLLLLSVMAVVFTAAAWTAKLAWRRNMDAMAPLSTPESATGLGDIGKVRLFERPHMTENYLTREMGFRIARKHAGKLRQLSLLSGGVVPAVIALVLPIAGSDGGLIAALAMALAVAAHVLGMLAERWLFFAEARHAVMNYYGG